MCSDCPTLLRFSRFQSSNDKNFPSSRGDSSSVVGGSVLVEDGSLGGLDGGELEAVSSGTDTVIEAGTSTSGRIEVVGMTGGSEVTGAVLEICGLEDAAEVVRFKSAPARPVVSVVLEVMLTLREEVRHCWGRPWVM